MLQCTSCDHNQRGYNLGPSSEFLHKDNRHRVEDLSANFKSMTQIIYCLHSF